jgi:tungstate transport system substrate-binding protein
MRKILLRVILLGMILIVLLGTGCIGQKSNGPGAPGTTNPPVQKVQETFTPVQGKLIMATTTSTYDSGLLDILNPVFQKKCNCIVEVIPKGTGAAIQMAKDGDADLIFVHARGKEDAFVNEGYGINRRDVMYNDFVILGPESGPAKIKGMTDAAGAFRNIEASGEAKNAVFFSRGDNSGTHTKEKAIWDAACIVPSGTWYNLVGKGMGDTLTAANEKLGYTLADRGTYIKWKAKEGFDLRLLVEGPVKGGDPILKNPYGIIAVNPEKYPDVNYELAMEYIEFVTSKEGQKLIRDYKLNGEQLFFPDFPDAK